MKHRNLIFGMAQVEKLEPGLTPPETEDTHEN